MNPDLLKLQTYPFEKLAALKAGCTPPGKLGHIALSIGEPKHASPALVMRALQDHLPQNSQYPLTKGMPALRESISRWLQRRFGLPTAPDAETQVLPVSGTREALFAFAQAVVDRSKTGARVLMPNPFYQIYEGAALLAGATPYFYNTTRATAYLPDFDAIPDAVWQHCQLLYICTPGNPTGAVISEATLQMLIKKSLQYDFVIASDECYSEIFFDEANPPVGLLQAAANMGHYDYKNCVVFHSLSKRSNLPGMRSGFVAGDAAVMKSFLLYRTYHGCALPPAHQYASIAAWNDEEHVLQNRELYRQKFEAVLKILTPVCDVEKPDAAFYLWMRTPGDDTEFARELFAQQNVTVLPGSYLSREAEDGQNGIVNPGNGHVRMALVAPLEECIEAAQRVRRF